jgi:gliding motility-associated-like protein
VSFQEPGSAISTVCRSVKIGLCNINPPPCVTTISVEDSCLNSGTKFELVSSSFINNVTWDFGDTQSGTSNSSTLLSPTHQFSSIGNFIVKATVVMSCGNYISTQNVEIFTCDTTKLVLNEVFVPEAFSPNNDGNNDKVFVRGSIKEFTFSVFNRWGELVFRTSSQITGWDGTFRDKELDAGVFVYYLTGTDSTGKNINKKGNISLVK